MFRKALQQLPHQHLGCGVRMPALRVSDAPSLMFDLLCLAYHYRRSCHVLTMLHGMNIGNSEQKPDGNAQIRLLWKDKACPYCS